MFFQSAIWEDLSELWGDQNEIWEDLRGIFVYGRAFRELLAVGF